MVNLTDIAREVGVSVSTVSRVLNNTAPISEATRRRVFDAAKHLGYNKRPMDALPDDNNNAVGIVIPDMMSDYYTGVVNSLTEQFLTKKLSAILSVSRFDPEEAIRAVRMLYNCRVKCLLIIIDDCEEVSERLIQVVRLTHLPTMFITGTYISEMDFDCLYIDEERGNAMAVEHLLHRGYTHIGFLGETFTVNRRDVFFRTMQRFGMPVDPDFVRMGEERAERGGYLRMKEILALRGLPDAVFASYDQMAIGAIHAIREAGLRIPQDIAVIGFDGIASSGYIEGGLTTISCPYEDMASIAMRILLKRMEAPYSQPQQVAIKPILSVRRTT